MPRVRVEWMAGRTQVQREEVARRITQALVEIGGAPLEAVGVVFTDVPETHFYKGGVEWSKRSEPNAGD